jgi:hypothetical protein
MVVGKCLMGEYVRFRSHFMINFLGFFSIEGKEQSGLMTIV